MQDLVNAVVEMMEDEAMALTKKYVAKGVPPVQIIDAYKEALRIIGKRFEECTYFVPELVLAGEMMKAATELIRPMMTESASNLGTPRIGKLLLGTVEGDIHDIGKDMVHMLMDINGFEVLDLGVDVPAQRFWEEYTKFQPEIIGMSGLLTLAFESMKQVVDLLKDRGARDNVKVIIGGGQMDEQACKYVGADAFATDVVAGVNICKGWVGQLHDGTT
ncbi:MAG TPA: cobalamin-dependent protein [Syntrophobacteraceae bacterium]|nr:cobalamin-dependent protein [Syntrophobacteraceae bacterium]